MQESPIIEEKTPTIEEAEGVVHDEEEDEE
uniref:Uncharacterized protein n=1 Tax=Rhizophora mucronata TaxID=61149 RepID=A0A2P2IWQ7_RHIMU